MKKILLAVLMVLTLSSCALAATAGTWGELVNAIAGSDATITLTGDITAAGTATILATRTVNIKSDPTTCKITGPAPFFTVNGNATFENVVFNGATGAATDNVVNVSATGTARFENGTKFTDNAVTAVATAGTVTFDGVEFSVATAGAQVVSVTGGTTSFENGTSFTGNKVRAVTISGATTNVICDSVTFSGNAGAIAISAGDLRATSTTFTDNDAGGDDGGALNITGDGTVTFTGTAPAFSGNTALNGGAIYTTRDITMPAGATFSSNTATASGGAIYTTRDITVPAGATFDGNGATVSGGAIYSGGVVTVPSGTFSNNTAAVSGGAIYSASSASTAVTVSGGTFTSNRATGAAANGGAIYSIGAATVSSGTFSSNTATASGGAIYSASSTSTAVTVSGGAFTSNTAVDSGGAICADSGGVTVSGGTFSGNSTTNAAGGGGGAISSAGVVVSPSASGVITFSQNRSGWYGGAIYSHGNLAATITGTTFDQNSAENGAGVYLSAAAAVTNCVFKNNAATVSGGAVHLGAGATIEESSFNSNTAATAGGAIYLPVTLSEQNILQCSFKENAAGSGGAIHQPGGDTQTVSVVRSYFESNTATAGIGGAINIAGARFDLSQSTFSQNEATSGTPSRGGAVACDSQSYGIVNTTFVGNKVGGGGNGGALYLDTDAGSGLTKASAVFYCTFTDNAASGGSGGGLYSNASSIVLEASVLVGNSATTGRDIFRASGGITSGGFNVICNYGSTSGGNVDWKTESGVTGLKGMDAFDSTYTRDLVFGSNVLGAHSSEKIPYLAGSSLDTTMQSDITTVKLNPNASSATVLNPALGILSGTIGQLNFTNYFNGSPAGVWYAHEDARGVLRNQYSSTTVPAGGMLCDAGAYQTIDSSGSGPGTGGGIVSHVQIGGLPNFTLRVGQTCSLAASVYVYDTSTGGVARSLTESVNWRSSNPSVAQIDQYGNLILLSLGEALITATSVSNTMAGVTTADSLTVKVEIDQSYTNIASAVWMEMATFNIGLSQSGVQLYLVDADPSEVQSSSFVSSFSQHYGLEPKQITELTSANGLRFRSSSDYRSALSAVRPSTGFSMSTLDDPGTLIAMKYVYNLEWDYVSEILGRTLTEVSASDVVALFDTLSLVFTNEQENNVVLVDRSGSNGVGIEAAMSSGALQIGGVNTTEFDSVGSLVIHLYVYVGDASTSGRSANLIDGKIVVADNEANGRIDGDLWLISSGGGGGGGGGGDGGGDGGGGGGCDATGAAALVVGVAVIALARRRKR